MGVPCVVFGDHCYRCMFHRQGRQARISPGASQRLCDRPTLRSRRPWVEERMGCAFEAADGAPCLSYVRFLAWHFLTTISPPPHTQTRMEPKYSMERFVDGGAIAEPRGSPLPPPDRIHHDQFFGNEYIYVKGGSSNNFTSLPLLLLLSISCFRLLAAFLAALHTL
jgi:hypothetical protein